MKRVLIYIIGVILVYIGGYSNGQNDIVDSDSYRELERGAIQYRTKTIEVPSLPDVCDDALTYAQETNLGTNNQSYLFSQKATECYNEVGRVQANVHREIVESNAFNRYQTSQDPYSEEEIDAAFEECEEDGYDDVDYCDEILDDYLS